MVFISVSVTLQLLQKDIAACTWWCVFNVSGIIMGIGVVRDCGMHLWWFAVTVFIFQPRSFCWHWLGMQGQAECRCLLQVTLLCPYMEIYHLFLIGWMWDWCVSHVHQMFCTSSGIVMLLYKFVATSAWSRPLGSKDMWDIFVLFLTIFWHDFTLFYMCYM